MDNMSVRWLLVFVCSAALAQSSATTLSFDVASIRPSAPDSRGFSIEAGPGTLTTRNVSLRQCLEWAYLVQPFQLSGPSWLGDGRFDIAAKAADAASDDRLRLMLRALLAERFGVKLHREQKELPVYSIVLAKNGPKFHEPGPKDASKFLESKEEGPVHFSEDKTALMAERAPMSEIASKISGMMQRPVIDRTGLKERYDLRIDITPYVTETKGETDPISLLFTGFQRELGLKLEAGRDTVDLLVIDSASKVPSEN